MRVWQTVRDFFVAIGEFFSQMFCSSDSSEMQPRPLPETQRTDRPNPPPRQTSPSSLVDFYHGRANHPSGSTFDQVLGWTDDRLESQHDYIQWLFPLKTHSRFNPTAPIFTDAILSEFRSSSNLLGNMHRAYIRMLAFYGLEFDPSSNSVQRASNFSTRARIWLTLGNHNHLRITRILTSLRLTGLQAEANQFFAILQDINQNEGRGRIAPNSFQIWQNALTAH